MTILVAGDAHIGSGSSLGRLPDQRDAWERLCRIAVDQSANIIGTGDFFHHRKPSAAEVDAFQSGLRILREGGREFVSITGNHEVLTGADVSCLEVACAGFDTRVLRVPEVVETMDGPVGFLPWAPYSDARKMTEALMICAEDLASRGATMLIAHWALSGASLPTGLPILDLAEPVLDSFALGQMFQIVLAGHIHKRQTIIDGPDTLVAHVGPLCRGNFGEASIETGYWLTGAFGNDVRVAGPHDLPDRPFVALNFDLRGELKPTDCLIGEMRECDVDGAILRISWQQTAEQTINTAAVLAEIAESTVHRLDRLEPIIERAVSVRSQGITEDTPPEQSWDTWQAAQVDVSEDIASEAREQAHQQIAGIA